MRPSRPPFCCRFWRRVVPFHHPFFSRDCIGPSASQSAGAGGDEVLPSSALGRADVDRGDLLPQRCAGSPERSRPPRASVYQQARLFENVVGAIHRHYIDSLGEGDLYQRAAVGPGDLPQRPLRRAAGPGELPRVPAADDRHQAGPRRAGRARPSRGPAWARAMASKPGDEILSIDGKSTDGLEPAKVDDALRGGAAPTVTVVVRPVGSDRPVVRRITRTAVHVPAASSGVLLDGGVGYVVLHRMSEHAADELRERRGPPRSRTGMKALVLDLRSNPGGLDPRGRKGGRALPPAGRHRGRRARVVPPGRRESISPKSRPIGMTSGWCCW